MDRDPGRVVRFLAITLAWTWSAWWTAVAAGWSPRSGPGALLYGIGGLGPVAAAIVLLLVADTPEDRRDYLRRLLQVRRLGLRGAALALGVPPLAALAGAAFWSAAGGAAEAAVPAAPVLLALLLLGPIPEEPGWRGYAFGPLQSFRGTLGAALLLGGAWALWHLPLFAWPGTYQHGLGLATGPGALFVAGLLVDSVFMAGLYNRTGGSTLGAIGYHFATNASGETWELPQGAQLIRLLFTAAAAALVVRGRGRGRAIRG